MIVRELVVLVFVVVLLLNMLGVEGGEVAVGVDGMVDASTLIEEPDRDACVDEVHIVEEDDWD